MSAQRLRDAAKVLRELAGATEPGPWETRRGGLIARASTSPRLVWPSHASADGQYWEDQRERNDATAAYIATMSPPVALALADWLDSVAGRATDIADTLVLSGPAWAWAVARANVAGLVEASKVADLILGADS